MRRPVLTVVGALALALGIGLGLVFFNAYRKGITIRLGESGQPDLLPPPPANTALSGGQPQHYTNEQLHSMLQEETSQLGIKRFAPRGERQEEPAASFLLVRLRMTLSKLACAELFVGKALIHLAKADFDGKGRELAVELLQRLRKDLGR